jgi:hypothetical protein
MKREVREKNEVIRALRERVQELERAVNAEHEGRVEKKELYELFRVCVEGWKREIKTKSRKDLKNLSIEQLSSLNKKYIFNDLGNCFERYSLTVNSSAFCSACCSTTASRSPSSARRRATSSGTG